MKVENISVAYTQKFNLGNYESVELQVFLHGKVDEDESVEGCIQYLSHLAKEGVMTEAKKVADCHNVLCPSVEKFFYGKPVDEFPSQLNQSSKSDFFNSDFDESDFVDEDELPRAVAPTVLKDLEF